MASKEDVVATTEKGTGMIVVPRKINSEENIGKDSDIDMIIDEIARESADKGKKGSAAKPKPVKMGSVKRTARGRFIRQRHQRGRGFMRRVVKMPLPKIPVGILYVKNGTYIGYHCTYCNCALKTLFTVKQHVAGARHRETLKFKKIKGSTSKKDAEKPSAVPVNKNQPKSDLKSSLDEYLATVTEPVVGLSHITEMVSEGSPSSFECGLCKYSGSSSNIKEHINGTRHRLMYLKAVDPERIAEMMSKNLTKTDRNKKIIDHAKELEGKNGRGTIQLKSKEPEEVSDEEEGKSNAVSSTTAVKIRKSIRGARERSRGRGSLRGGRLASVRRGMRGIRGGRRPLIRGGRRGGLIRGQTKKSFSQRSSERRKQSLARRFRGRISHNNARAPIDPYAMSYYSDYNDWVMRTGNNPYEADPYYGRDPYYPEPYSSPREYYIDHPYERMDPPLPQEVHPRYDYRLPYDDETPYREYAPSRNRDQRSTSPVQNRPSQYKPEPDDAEGNPLKNLPNFSVTNEKDAGIVMNVITSLAESLLGYKMHGSPQEILQKLDEEKKKSTSGHPDKSDSRGAEWAGRRSQDHIQHKQDIRDRTPPPSRRHMDSTRDRSPQRRPYDIVQDRPSSPPRRPLDMRDRSPPLQRRPVDMRAQSPPLQRRPVDVRARSPPLQRRPVDMRARSPPLQRRPVDMRARSLPLQRRPVDMRAQSPPLQRRPVDMRARSPPRRSMDVMRDRTSSPQPPKRSFDVMQDRSLPRSTMEISHTRSPPRGPMGIMRRNSPPLSRRSMDVMRNRSPPPPSRGSTSFMRDRSPPRPSVVDDMFDDYQKSQNAMRSSYSTPTGNVPLGYKSPFSSSSNYGTPASYISPLSYNTSSFNRSSEARRNISSFGDNQERNILDWKYRSLR